MQAISHAQTHLRVHLVGHGSRDCGNFGAAGDLAVQLIRARGQTGVTL